MPESSLNSFLDKVLNLKKIILKEITVLLLISSFVAFLVIIFEVGFEIEQKYRAYFRYFYLFNILIFFLSAILGLLLKVIGKKKYKIARPEFMMLLTAFAFLFFNLVDSTFNDNVFFHFFNHIISIRIFIVLIFLVEISKSSIQLQTVKLNPSMVFVLSFIVLILTGTALLLLPEATTKPLSFLDALFTSTSAVCVTGLVVVDTASHFTNFGQLIILSLIQIGGLGIMTFTTFFGFLFSADTRYESSLFMKDFVNEDKIGEIIHTIGRILAFTIAVEMIGAFFIWYSISEEPGFANVDTIKFSIFHSISAFCNAGFSTLPGGLYDEAVRLNYSVLWIIGSIIIVGGIGFPVMFDFYNNIVYYFKQKARQLFTKQVFQHRSRLLRVHTKLVVITTAVLLIAGFISFYIAENDHSLNGMSLWGKISNSFFGAVTPRTAGFNSVDMGALSLSTVLLYLLWMWIGASPGSTGGGLKTTTFAVAILNTGSIVRGKDRTEVFRREVTNESVRKSFAVIILSFLVIGVSVFFVANFNPELPILSVVFECFSAFSTTGLSLGITSSLHSGSKLVIILTMLVGRVGTLTILAALIKRVRTLNYRYPEENVFVN